jgi:hypothetical protein
LPGLPGPPAHRGKINEQPPVVMKRYIENLRTSSEEANLRREEAKEKRPHTDPRLQCETPLTDQIEVLMLSLPPVQRDRPWSMDELVARLQGRYSARPHPMNVGQALAGAGLDTEA